MISACFAQGVGENYPASVPIPKFARVYGLLGANFGIEEH